MVERIADCEGCGTEWTEEIVRCRDCAHSSTCYRSDETGSRSYTACFRLFDAESDLFFEVEPDGFCAWGERREQ